MARSDWKDRIERIPATHEALFLVVLLLSGAALGQGVPFAEAMQKGAEAMRSGDALSAIDAFRDAVQRAPSSAEAHLNLGLALIQTGNHHAAAEQLKRACELKPMLRGPHLFLGIALYRAQDYSVAEKALRSETKLTPLEPQAWMWLGVTQLAQGHDIEAVETLNKAQQLKPDDQDILYHLGRAYMQASKSTYQRMYQLAPDSWRVHQVLAQSYDEAGRQQEAIAEYKAAIAAAPVQPELHTQLGDLYRDGVQLDLAEQEYREELRVNPGNEETAYRLANILLDQSRPKDAIGLLTELLKNNANSRLLNYQMGRALLETGDAQGAATALNRVVDGVSDVDGNTLQQSYFYLSRAYIKLGDKAAEQQALAKFVVQKRKNDAEEKAKLESHAQKQQRKENSIGAGSPVKQP